ncbi:MAG: hypothetical protein EB101_12205, partial [Chitinophagia bacterium]|nr:hypothetical protein [Chitinophagia bacterium]
DYNGQLQIGQGTVIVGVNNGIGTNITTANRGVDLGLNVGDTSTANNVSLLASNGVTVGQSIYVSPNTSGGTRTIGLSGNGTNTFNNEMYLDGNLTVSVGTATTDQTTISGAIINTGGLIKTGSGNLILSGANTYSGGTTISAGTLQIGAGSASGSISGAITNNGTLVFNRSDAVTLANVISGTGAVTKASGSGNLTLSGANTFSGKVTVSSGTLTASGVSDSAGSGLGTGNQIELGSGANLQVTVGAGTTNTTARSLIFNGSGTLGASTGTLVWNGNTTFNASTASTFAFNSLAAGTNVFGGIIGNTTNNSAVSLNFQSSQIWSLTGANTFTGGITIGGGKVMATTIADTGTASSVGAGGTIRFGYFDNAPTTFEYVGNGNTNNRQIKLGASAGSNNNTATFLQNGTGA